MCIVYPYTWVGVFAYALAQLSAVLVECIQGANEAGAVVQADPSTLKASAFKL